MIDNQGFVYYILCKPTGKFYIGSTYRHKVDFRFNEHKSKLKLNKHPNKHLQNSWNKYGKESFIFEVIENCNKEKAIEANSKKVINQCTGEIYNTISEFCKKYNLSNVTFNKYVGKEFYKGIFFSYYEDGLIYEIYPIRLGYRKISNVKTRFNRKVINLDTLEVFPNLSIAAKNSGLNRRTLNDCVLGRQKTCGGYRWEYI